MTTIASSGEISFSQIAATFGATGPYSLSSFIRGGSYVPNGISANANIPTSAVVQNKFTNYYNSTVVFPLVVSATVTHYNAVNAFVATYGALASTLAILTRKYIQLVINSGVTIGATSSATPALDIGQFTSGTNLTVLNNGSIQAAGGLAGAGGTVYGAAANTAGGPYSGGKGGDAIKANYLNQTVTITNNGTIYAGGGGGGGGSKGANAPPTTLYVPPQASAANRNHAWQWYTDVVNPSPAPAYNVESSLGYSESYYYPERNPYYKRIGNGTYSSYLDNDGKTYVRGTYRESGFYATTYDIDGNPTSLKHVHYYDTGIYYSGADGIGGNGGTGAVGRGYNNPTISLVGIIGSTGGTATGGARGATGATGGNGGAFGASGSASSAPAGSAGYYLLKGSASVTLTGGTTAGLLA